MYQILAVQCHDRTRGFEMNKCITLRLMSRELYRDMPTSLFVSSCIMRVLFSWPPADGETIRVLHDTVLLVLEHPSTF